MAPKRPSPLEDPPAASSSEEEVSEEGESEEESDEEEEEKPDQKQQQHKKASSPSIPLPTAAADKKPSKKPETQPQSSSSEEGSGSESESDSDHPPRGVADLNVKPIASKPMDDASKAKKPRSKSATLSSVAATPPKSTAKRPVENSGGEGKDSKRAKKKGAEADGDAVETEKKSQGGDSKRPLFQRLWSEDDEIVILKGMIDYSSKKGADPVTDLDAYHEFIKKSLHIDVTRTQLMDKMRRLKKKYENNAGKAKNGEDRTFSNPHEQKAYDLSKKVWGKEANNGGGVTQAKPNGKAKKGQKSETGLTPAEKAQLLASLHGPKDEPPKKDTEEQNSGPSQVPDESILFNRSIVAGGLDQSFMKEGLKLIDSAKRSELEEKWRNLQVAETEIFLRRIELVREQTKLVLDAYKKH